MKWVAYFILGSLITWPVASLIRRLLFERRSELDRWSDRAKRVMKLARGEARRLGHEYVGTEHLLLGLMHVPDGVAYSVLRDLHPDLDGIQLEVERRAKAEPPMANLASLLTPGAQSVIELAVDESANLGHLYLGTEHLLLGLIKEREGIAGAVLQDLGLQLRDAREQVLDYVGADEGED